MTRKGGLRLCDSLLVVASSYAFVSAAHAANGQPFQELQNQVDQLQQQADQLQGQIDQLTSTSPVEVSVTCGQDTIADALATYAGNPAPLVITINGNCDESVSIQRDDVTLQGASSGDGLTLSAAALPAIDVAAGTSGTVVQNMTLDLVGGWGLTCVNTTVTVNGVVMNDAQIGIVGAVGGRCIVTNTEINGPGGAGTRGAVIGDQAVLQLGASTIRDVDVGIYVHSHADVFIGTLGGGPSPLIEDTNIAAQVFNGSNLTLGSGATISNNGTGIEVFPSSTLGVNLALSAVTPVVSDNTTGIILHQLSSLTSLLAGVVHVEFNDGFGIVCESNVAISGPLPSLNDNNGGGAQHDGCPLP